MDESIPDVTDRRALRDEVEAFFVSEAELLDDWQLTRWLELFSSDAKYLVHPLDYPSGEAPADALFLVSDDRHRLESRVEQLCGKTSWAENPRSRTRRLVTNFRAEPAPDQLVKARANFAVWRFKNDCSDVYVGRYDYLLERADGGRLRIRERHVRLDLESLRPQGKLSFIL